MTGTSDSQVWHVLRACGYVVAASVGYKKSERPTLAGWLASSRADRKPGRVFLVVAGNHWQLIEGRRYVCGITTEVVSIKHEKVKRRARVERVYEIAGDYRHPNELLAKLEAKKAARKAQLGAGGLRAKVLKAKREMLIDWDFWDDKSDPPSIIYPGAWWADAEAKGIDDPYEGDHSADTWEAAAKLVDDYQKIYDQL